MTITKQASTPAHRFTIQWLLLGLALLAAGGAIGYSIIREHNRIDASERERLTTQAKVVDENLEHQLVALNLALLSIRSDLPYLKAQKDSRKLVNRRLQAMSDAMPGVRTILITDAYGIVSASNREQLIGLSAREREYFRTARQNPDPALLYISPPFKTTLGVYAMNVGRVLLDAHGSFVGVISATLDPEFFSVLLNSVLYTPGMRASLIHGDGKVFVEAPNRKDLAGMDLAKPGSRYTQHVKSGRTTNLFTAGRAYSTGDERMSAWRTVRPTSLLMDKPLMVSVNRDIRGIFAPWRSELFRQGGLFGVMVFASFFSLYCYQRRQQKYDRLAASYLVELQKGEERAKLLAQENHLMAEIGRIVGSTLNIDAVYERFAEKVREILPFDSIQINIINTQDNTRTIQYYAGKAIEGRKIGDVVPLGGSVTERIVQTRSGLLITAQDNDDLLKQYPGILNSIASGVKSRIGIPLISQDEIIGTLLLRSVQPDAYTEKDLRLAARVGSQIAGAIANAQLFRERKQAEEALRESERKFRSIAEHSFIGISIIQDGVFRYVNPKYAEIHGYSIDELMDHFPIINLVHPEDRPTVQQTINQRLAGQTVVDRYECRKVKKNGEVIIVELYGSPVSYDNQPAVIGVLMDITDRKRAEEEKRSIEGRLQRAEKMEALGQLAGGVAHDLNNVLGVLSGYSELLLERLPAGNPLREYAANILKSSQRGAAIIQDLLTLTRRGVMVAKVVDLNGIIANLLTTPEFARLKDYHSQVAIKIDLGKDVLHIKGSPVHLEKTVLNLVANATEAITGSGEVLIRTENRYLDQAVRGYDKVEEGDYVVLTIADTGTGISPEDRNKMFEPFYTKKKMGRSGTGLGLAIVWGTVKDHEGYIDVQSAPGVGTTFTLYFPVTREELGEDAQLIPLEQYLGQGETVLVVDDVQEQRQVATSLLIRLGYRVNAVASGEEALAYLRSNKADILVLDMIMEPGLDGLETYRQVLKINPHQPAIIVSGFSETDRVKEAQELGAGAYVKKPYLLEKVGMAIREELLKSTNQR